MNKIVLIFTHFIKERRLINLHNLKINDTTIRDIVYYLDKLPKKESEKLSQIIYEIYQHVIIKCIYDILVKNDAYQCFINEYNKYKHTSYETIDEILAHIGKKPFLFIEIENIITNAFPWIYSNQGYYFWYRIHCQVDEAVSNLKLT